jgi:hypothetical protein
VFVIAIFNLGSAAGGLDRRQMLSEVQLSMPLWLLIAQGGIWGIVWLALTGGLWMLREWARRATLVAFPLYELAVLSQRVLFARGDYERGRLPFAVGVGIVTAALVVLVLTRSPIVSAFKHTASPEKEQEES